MSSLLKGGWIELKSEEKRIIDTNALFNRRLNGFSQPVQPQGAYTSLEEPDESGFASGVQAQILEGLTEGMDGDAAVIHAESAVQGPSVEETRQQVEQILAEAQAQVAAAQQEAEQIRMQAQQQAAEIKEGARQEGIQQGYQEGIQQAAQEAEQQRQQLASREQELDEAYEAKVREIEPQLVDTLTGIYEHVFQVELQGYRDILFYLISSTMRKIEGNRSYFIHVSKEDYPYVSMQKKQLANIVSSDSTVEIVEDLALTKNAGMIETENGVFDCGISTQLTELANRLKLLSYEKE